jgi:hypothetical protein
MLYYLYGGRMRSAVDVVICVLHCVGPKRIKDDARLWKLFHEAAVKHPVLFGSFKCHPQYGDNPCLSAALSILHLGGSIGFWSSDLHSFSATDAVLGKYGQEKLEELYPQEKEAVEYLAFQIKELIR